MKNINNTLVVGILSVRKVDENKGAYMVNIGEVNQSVKNHPFAKHWSFFSTT